MGYNSITEDKKLSLHNEIKNAWDQIAPCWPLKNIIAVNPLHGFENLTFDQAIKLGNKLFQNNDFSIEMNTVNRETIKWCQAYFDEGQATIKMPLRDMGFYKSIKKLIIYDKKIDTEKKNFISNLPNDNLDAIYILLKKLKINYSDINLFLKILLTTLPGWASYIKYKSKWNYDSQYSKNLEHEYVTIRLILIFIFCKTNIKIYELIKNKNIKIDVNAIKNTEIKYHHYLFNKLHDKLTKPLETIKNKKVKAQLIFCIDVRSEPFRKAIESEGDYETFGFAGFFGIPMYVESSDSEKYASCPVLLKPDHTIKEYVSGNEKIKLTKKIYQSLKYNFTTPFLLAEFLGFWSGIWMILKTFYPIGADNFKKNILKTISPKIKKSLCFNETGILDGIPISDQVNYAESMLRMIDLIKDFAPIILLCGHGASTVNNPYNSSLDCGACGGHDGSHNARVMAIILNSIYIRNELKKRGIDIPTNSKFIAALHNTTTDNINLFSSEDYEDLKKDLGKAKLKNNSNRIKDLFYKKNPTSLSVDWAQTRPEWGLAKNAAFIVGPRDLTKKIDLEGRCFLHSYNFNNDENLEILTAILTAPMIVAQWINCQYLFSTLDPVAYGGGSKITQNITGKIGVMQGNGSDLMHGLPLQSTHKSDVDTYHEPMRLMTIIYAPKNFIANVIIKNSLLEKLAKNEWVKFFCIDPNDKKVYLLKNDLEWDEDEYIQQC